MATMVQEKKKQCMTTRDVLWYLVFTGFAVNYMIRINLNIAIVAMVKAKPASTESINTGSECLREAALNELREIEEQLDRLGNLTFSMAENASELQVTHIFNHSFENETLRDVIKHIEEEPPTEFEGFTWNEYQQGLILGAFFWLHWTTQVPGGLLAAKYGTKLIFGFANFSAVLICFIIPVSSSFSWKCLIFVRCIQGILAGFAWPAMHNMTAKWIPPNERSKFVTAYLGSSVGAALTFPMCGYIIDLWGWQYVFYVSGILGSIWFTCWWLFVFDTPAEHPRISEEEKEYIHTSLGHSVSKEKAPVPWRHILTSVPVWMNVLAQWGGIWGLFTLMTHAPSYFKYIHGWNIRVTGLLSGMPHMVRMLFAYKFSLISDWLLRTEKMSRTNVRKLATGLCTIGQAVFLLGLAYSGCDYNAAIVCLTMATAIHGTVSSGPLASFVDISPNYASVALGLANTVVAIVGFITPTVVGYVTYENVRFYVYVCFVLGVCLGICGMIAVLPGFISPAVVGLLTYQNNTVQQWQLVFLIAVGMLMVSGLAYILFSRSDLEPWNNPESAAEHVESEMKSLKTELEEKEDPNVLITEKIEQ